MSHTLVTPIEAEQLLIPLFCGGKSCQIKVCESRAFRDHGWLSLGDIALRPGSDSPSEVLAAIQRGAFEWRVPGLTEAHAELADLLETTQDEKGIAKLNRITDATAAIAFRTGLRLPHFDPFALEAMVLRRATTFIADTSAVLQGGLDFVARHLHPAARIKVPGTVQMEIVNLAERFLATRRAPHKKPQRPIIMLHHILSQGGQRVLVRLELNSDIEIERNFLLGDPLRAAFQPDDDVDLKGLNLSVGIKAYADRLILEAARHHQAQSSWGHRVQLLTSDQGLARMALGEGISPAHFSSVVGADMFGHTLTGSTLDPFNGELRVCGASAVLWEIATAFGAAKLESENGSVLELAAFGENLRWSPVHSHSDLLWCDASRLEQDEQTGPAAVGLAPLVEPSLDGPLNIQSAPSPEVLPSNVSPLQTRVLQKPAASFRKFNVRTMIELITGLDTAQTLREDEVIRLIKASNRQGTEDYRRFLVSAGMIEVVDGRWTILPLGSHLSTALRFEIIDDALQAFQASPSFMAFIEELRRVPPTQTLRQEPFGQAMATYRTLGEILQVCATIYGEGIFPTFHQPNPSEFATLALARFRELEGEHGLVATGAWLEALIRRDGIHPAVARTSLNIASSMKLLTRFTEGSTTDIRHDKHVLHVLRSIDGTPRIERIHLYRGDYIIPGKASSSIRIEEPKE